MRRPPVWIAPLVLLAAACAPADNPADDPADRATGQGADQPTDQGGSPGDGSTPAAEDCSAQALPVKNDGVLTVATDSPAFGPWFVDDDPTNGKGFESAVAYAVAAELGFTRDQVEWVTVRFNNSYKPGPKDFDFDINQISITDARERVVDFSDGYYAAAQGVIALEDSPAAQATSVADLAGYRLGAQTGTTSLTAIREVIRPEQDPLVFQTTSAAKQALLNDQVDAVLADVPTAFFITAVEIPQASIVGQFQPETGRQEEFGLLLEEGSELVPCVNQALAALREDGTLEQIEQQWLSDVVDVPVLE